MVKGLQLATREVKCGRKRRNNICYLLSIIYYLLSGHDEGAAADAPSRRASGSALIVVLGVLAIMTALIFAYAFSARTERLAARQSRDSMLAQKHIDSIVSIIMGREVPLHILGTRGDGGNVSISPFSGRVDFSSLAAALGNNKSYYTKRAFTSCLYDSHDCGTCDNFLNNISTNYIPNALHKELTQLSADWVPIESVEEESNRTIYTNALYAYAVVDLSGFLDANWITSNQIARLARNKADIENAGLFIEDRAIQSSPALGTDIEGYVSYRDLFLRNRGLASPPSHLLHFSYDPAPDVTVTNGPVYSDYSQNNVGDFTVPKLDINGWTNDFTGSLSSTTDLERHYERPAFRAWLAEVTNRLAFCGFAAPEALAWNLVNFLDGDRVPQSPSPAPWRDDWPQEDVPLINEIAIAQVPLVFGYTNCYAAAVELWHPFVPNPIRKEDEAELIVAVYTNWTPSAFSHTDSNWTNDIVFLPSGSEYGFTLTNRIERMENGTSSEFSVFTAPPEGYVSFPVEIVNFSESDHVKKTVSQVAGDIWESDDRGTNTLYSHFENLPIGIQRYTSYVQSNETYWVRSEVIVTNEIRLITRVRLGERWVDEAMAYDPDPDSDYHEEPYRFLSTCGWQVNDPRRNGHRDNWESYEGITYRESAEGEQSYTCTLSGATNAICNPWHTYAQGLPIVHFNGPATRAGDIGYIYEPYSSFDNGDTIRTNTWQSICLADERNTASHSSFAFSAGSALELFTARCATNRSVRGLVSASSPYPAVWDALLADAEIGHGLQRTRLPDSAIEWMTNVVGEIQHAMYDTESIPIGVGDFCMAAGNAPSYKTIPEKFLSGEDVWHWQGSVGNEIKEDILRDLSERLSFRQQLFLLVIDVRVTTPALSVRAERRAIVLIVRDAYTGAWRVVERHLL
jgi:hypothetical protein